MQSVNLTPDPMPHNKRLQSDQNVRYALILTADAGRYAALVYHGLQYELFFLNLGA